MERRLEREFICGVRPRSETTSKKGSSLGMIKSLCENSEVLLVKANTQVHSVERLICFPLNCEHRGDYTPKAEPFEVHLKAVCNYIEKTLPTML